MAPRSSYVSLAGAAISIIFCSRQNTCRDKNILFVATKRMLAVTKLSSLQKLCLSRKNVLSRQACFLSRQTRVCRDKNNACHDKNFCHLSQQKLYWSQEKVFVATKNMFCRGQNVFLATRPSFCRDKNTNMILVAAPANDSLCRCDRASACTRFQHTEILLPGVTVFLRGNAISRGGRQLRRPILVLPVRPDSTVLSPLIRPSSVWRVRPESVTVGRQISF